MKISIMIKRMLIENIKNIVDPHMTLVESILGNDLGYAKN
jgi:hypothetical protein